MAHAAGFQFDNEADDDIPDRHYGKPYDRELYNQLAAIMKLKEAEMAKDAAYCRRKGIPQTPPSERFKDLRKYLYEHQSEARTDTALVACSHTTRPYQCMRARADMMRANPAFPLTFSQRLGALGRTPSLPMGRRGSSSFVSFLARQLSQDPTDSRSDAIHATAMQGRFKKKTPLLLKDREDRKPPDKGGRKSRTHKSRKNRSRKSCKNRNL
jgi:hypothetical protein